MIVIVSRLVVSWYFTFRETGNDSFRLVDRAVHSDIRMSRKNRVSAVSLNVNVMVSLVRYFIHGLLELNNIANSKLNTVFLSKIEANQTSLITNDSLEELSWLIIFVNSFSDDLKLNNLSNKTRIVVSWDEISNLYRSCSFNDNRSSFL